jgi:hypothetical protein
LPQSFGLFPGLVDDVGSDASPPLSLQSICPHFAVAHSVLDEHGMPVRMTTNRPLTDEEIAAIDRRAETASPVPWEAFVEGRDHIGGDSFIRIGGLDDSQADMYVSQYVGTTVVKVPSADLDFIAHARQDGPPLVEEVRRLRGA